MNRLLVAGMTLGVMMSAGEGVARSPDRSPDCKLNTRHFLVDQSNMYIKAASGEDDREKREQLLHSARRNLGDAIKQGQANNPAVWYLLGRTYVMLRDAAGADSAFTRAEELLPACAEDISEHRQVMWAPLINGAVDAMRVGDFDSAKVMLRKANAIYRGDNLGFYYMARLYGSEGELDSATHYFKQVVELGAADETGKENYDEAITYLAQLYRSLQEWDSAAVWYGKYREMYPSDANALIGLATAHRESGDTTTALALYDTVLVLAAEMDPLDLFATGEALFVAEQYNRALRAFELGLERNPYYRPGLYNLAQAWFAITDVGDTQAERDSAARALETTVRRLIEVDPQNLEAKRLLTASFQLQDKKDSTLAVLQRMEDMTFEVRVDQSESTEGSFSLFGRIINLMTENALVPSITFEFLDAEGGVVATESVETTTVAASGEENFALTPVGEGIVAYRYQVSW